MNEPLIDDDGYPRADVDVYQVRHARHKIICIFLLRLYCNSVTYAKIPS